METTADAELQRCLHEWRYRGRNPYFTLCPRCRTHDQNKEKEVVEALMVGSPQASTLQITPIGDDEL